MLRSKGLCAALAVSLLASFALAQDAPAKPKRAKGQAKDKSALRGEYAIVASELKLSDEKKAEFAKAVEALNTARSEWAKANAAKLEELAKALKAARDAKDKDKTKEIQKQLTELKAQQEKIAADAQAKVRAVLTPEQQTQWDVFNLYRQVLRRYGKAELTDQQKEKAKGLAAEAAKQLSATTDAKAASALKKDLDQKVAALLTPEQTAKMKAPAAKKPAKDDKADPKK